MPTPADLPKKPTDLKTVADETEDTPIHDEVKQQSLVDADPVDVSRFASDEDDDPLQYAGEVVEDEEDA